MEASPSTASLRIAPASEKEPRDQRRRRYAAPQTVSAPPALTPVKLLALRLLAECHLLSLPQIALLLEGATPRPKSAREKSARRHLRELFDAGLVAVVPVPRAALAARDAPNDAALLYGSAPNVYVPTAEGVRLVVEAGLVDASVSGSSAPNKRKASASPASPYGPKNSLFLAHELAVRDARVWAERLAYPARDSEPTCTVADWRDGDAADISLPSGLLVRPDARLTLRIGAADDAPCLVGLCETDRGTERGRSRWREKVERYAELFADAAERGADSHLARATGYRLARVLVFTDGARRRDVLMDAIGHECDGLGFPELAGRFWLASADDLLSANTGNAYAAAGVCTNRGIHAPIWAVAARGSGVLVPLIGPA